MQYVIKWNDMSRSDTSNDGERGAVSKYWNEQNLFKVQRSSSHRSQLIRTRTASENQGESGTYPSGSCSRYEELQ